mgnify:CR=1 FL=1
MHSTLTRALLLLTVATAGSCSCHPSVGTAPDLLVCLESCPSSVGSGIEFSDAVLKRTSSKTIAIGNGGNARLAVSGIRIEAPEGQSAAEFALAPSDDGGCSTTDAFRLAPGGECGLSLSYTPVNCGSDEVTLVVRSNDPDASERRVRVFTQPIGPRFVISPDPIDFGLVENRAGPVTATICNDGSEPGTVTDVTTEGVEFSLVWDGNDIERAPGDCFTVDVVYAMDEAEGGLGALVATALQSCESTVIPDGRAELYGPPVANCGGDQEVAPFDLVELNGGGSHSPGGDINTWRWEITSYPEGGGSALQFNQGEDVVVEGPEGELICPAEQGRDSSRPCFVAATPGVYVFALTIVDERASCALSDIGDACDAAAECCSFACDGGVCVDPAAKGAGVCRAGGGCAIASTNPTKSVCRVSVLPEESFSATLSWDRPADLDLHLVRCAGAGASGEGRWAQAPDGIYWNRPTADWCAPRTYNDQPCFINSDCTKEDPDTEFAWCTPTSISSCFDTGDPCAIDADCGKGVECITTETNVCTNAIDDPFLLIDSDAPGQPETIATELPCEGTYSIGVHYFGPTSGEPVTATVQVYVLGAELREPATPDLSFVQVLRPKDFWFVGRVHMPTGLAGSCVRREAMCDGEVENPVADTPLSSLPSPCGPAYCGGPAPGCP